MTWTQRINHRPFLISKTWPLVSSLWMPLASSIRLYLEKLPSRKRAILEQYEALYTSRSHKPRPLFWRGRAMTIAIILSLVATCTKRPNNNNRKTATISSLVVSYTRWLVSVRFISVATCFIHLRILLLHIPSSFFTMGNDSLRKRKPGDPKDYDQGRKFDQLYDGDYVYGDKLTEEKRSEINQNADQINEACVSFALQIPHLPIL